VTSDEQGQQQMLDDFVLPDDDLATSALASSVSSELEVSELNG
jgi:hypothetical protein